MEQNALTPVETGAVEYFTAPSQQPFSSFDMSTEEGQKKAIKCVAQADIRLTDFLDNPLVIDDFFAQPIQVKDDDGYNQQAVRLVIIDKNGTTYATTSSSIANALRQFYNIKGGNIKGLKVKVITVPTRGGFKAYTLVPAD